MAQTHRSGRGREHVPTMCAPGIQSSTQEAVTASACGLCYWPEDHKAAHLATYCQDLRSQAMWSPTMSHGPLPSLE